MRSISRAELFAAGKRTAVWLIILICYFCGLRAYMQMDASQAATVFLTGIYPDKARASEILEAEREEEVPADVCFYRDEGMLVLTQEDYRRQIEVRAAGICGNGALYDWRIGSSLQDDPGGCIIDEDTAWKLFGSVRPQGGRVSLDGREYEVRRVLPWKQNMILFCPAEEETIYTGMFIKEAENSTAQQFLMQYGLSGLTAEDGFLRAGAFLVLLILPVLMGMGLIGSAWKEQKRSSTGRLERYLWKGAALLALVALVYLAGRNMEISKSWIPGKWSDFQFWAHRFAAEKENLLRYLALPKTAVQVERLLCAARTVAWAAAAAVGYVAVLLLKTQASRRKEPLGSVPEHGRNG